MIRSARKAASKARLTQKRPSVRVFSQPDGASRKATSYGVRKRTTKSSTIMKRSHQWHQLVLFGSITQRDDDACAIACFIAPTSVRSLSADFRCASHALSLSGVFCAA